MKKKKIRRRKRSTGHEHDSAVPALRLDTDTPARDTQIIDLDAMRRQHAARYAGGREDRVQTIRFELDWIKRNGALVDVDVIGVSMLTGSIRLSELGFPDEVAVAAIGQVIMALSDAGALPEFVLSFARRSQSVRMSLARPVYARGAKSIESQVRQALVRHSYRKGLEKVLGSYYWVPVTAYGQWKADFDQRAAALEELKAELVDDMAGYRREVADGWRLIAREAYAAITKRVGQFPYTEKAFTDKLVQAATGRLPTAAQIQAGIRLEYATPVLLVPSEVEAELAEAARIRAQREIETAAAAEAAAERWQQKRLVEAETFEEMRERRAEADARIRIERDRAEFERRRLEAMHEAELEHARRQLAEMQSPFATVLESLRADVYDTVQNVLASIRKHGHVRGKTAQQAENLVTTFRLLNVAGDQELDRLLGNLESALSAKGADSARDTGAVEDALKEIATETKEAARNVARRLEPSQASMVLV